MEAAHTSAPTSWEVTSVIANLDLNCTGTRKTVYVSLLLFLKFDFDV